MLRISHHINYHGPTASQKPSRSSCTQQYPDKSMARCDRPGTKNTYPNSTQQIYLPQLKLKGKNKKHIIHTHTHTIKPPKKHTNAHNHPPIQNKGDLSATVSITSTYCMPRYSGYINHTEGRSEHPFP